ncbi:hypothetical protein [Arsenicibacter rosenii]|uniref:Uncharacterized protein n=1 Tax=Arsenicibacter rosenii TaxID=1750698 RepID=A0A1S2VKP9_9BACT|nr:hypothetical protein [Arsenicibacter rosenii]OIN58785.1 hypothetical protein BLX24_11140 [Arsenicibacter rosenii]
MQRIIKSFPLRKARATALIAVAGAALVTGCQDLRDTFSLKPLNGITARVSVEPAATQVTGAIVDAKTLDAISDARVTVTISGPDADRVVDSQGNKLPSTFTTKGSIALYLTGEVPTLEKPARILVQVTPPSYTSYMESSTNLVLTKAINDPFQVKLVDEKNLPADIAVIRTNFTVGAGGVNPSLKSLPIGNIQAAIKPGTVFLGEDGKPLAQGSRVDVFIRRGGAPVGSSVSLREGDKVSDVVLKLYDYLDIQFTSGGKPVTFTGNDIAMLIPADGTGGVDIVNYDGATGQFIAASRTAISNINGSTFIPLNITDVSKPIGLGEIVKNTCTGSLDINVVNAGNTSIEGFAYSYEIEQKGLKVKGSSSSSIDFPTALSEPATVKLFDSEGELFGTLSLNSLCGKQEKLVQYTKRVVNVSFKANVTCANGKTPKLNGSDLSLALYPNVTVWYAEKGKPLTSSTVVKQGEGQLIGLKPNTLYQARVDFEGSYNYEFTTGNSDTALEPIQVNIKSGTLVCPN